MNMGRFSAANTTAHRVYIMGFNERPQHDVFHRLGLYQILSLPLK